MEQIQFAMKKREIESHREGFFTKSSSFIFLSGFTFGLYMSRVEKYNGKRQDEDGIWVSKLTHHPRVADAVALTEWK